MEVINMDSDQRGATRDLVWMPVASAASEKELESYRLEYSKDGRRTKFERLSDGRVRLYAEFERPPW